MLSLNKFFLALAFLGGSAAAQASDGRLEPARIEFGKTSERLDEANGWSHGLGQHDRLSVTTGTLYSPAVYGSVTAKHNGMPVSSEILLGSYDVRQHALVDARLLSNDATIATMSFHSMS